MNTFRRILDIMYIARKLGVELEAIYLTQDEVVNLRHAGLENIMQTDGYFTHNNLIVGFIRICGCECRSY